jgi:hypothetical protein
MRQQGYLHIDHSASPGLTENEVRRMGLPTEAAKLKVFEADTLTCSHCKSVVVKNPNRIRERGYCRKCTHFVCDYCAIEMEKSDYLHNPFDMRIDIVKGLI